MKKVLNFHREIMEAYPDAKVILTVRDPVRWYNSVKNSIYRTRGLQKDPLVRWFGKLLIRFTGDADGMDCSLNVTKGMQRLEMLQYQLWIYASLINVLPIHQLRGSYCRIISSTMKLNSYCVFVMMSRICVFRIV